MNDERGKFIGGVMFVLDCGELGFFYRNVPNWDQDERINIQIKVQM